MLEHLILSYIIHFKQGFYWFDYHGNGYQGNKVFSQSHSDIRRIFCLLSWRLEYLTIIP